MNAKQRREYFRKIERLRAQLDRKYFTKVQKSILDQFKRFARDVEVYGVDGAKVRLGLDLWDKEMVSIFEEMYKEAVILFGNSVYRSLKIEANQKSETFGFNRQWTNDVLAFLAEKGFVLVADITSTTKDKLLKIVNDGITEGLGIDAIVKIILSDEQIQYSAFRARRIVRTEVMRASNMGLIEGAKAHRFQMDKMWISARDSRTRRIPQDEFDHLELDGVVVDQDEPFTSTGKKGEPVVAMAPGDISAPAGFVVNCRCTLGFIPKRDLNGRLIFKPRLNQPIVGGTNTQNIINQQIEIPKEETKDTIYNNILNIFKNNTNFKVKRGNVSEQLTINELKRKQNKLDELTKTYNTSNAFEHKYETSISFQTTARSYGYVQTTGDGRLLFEANFGSKSARESDRVFNADFTGIRPKSRVDLDNLDIATTVHEFGHLLALRHQLKQYNTPQNIIDYYKELKKINSAYKKELKAYYLKSDKYNVNQISLGDYAHTNIDEFMAESFTEYKLSSNPSKYAVLVGKLIDKYFKK